MVELKAKHPKMELNTKHPQIEMRNPVKKVGIEQIQSDWEQLDDTAVDFIKNKPTNLSSFINDVGFLTAHQDISGKADTADLAEVAFSGSYNDLTDKPSGEPEKVDYYLTFDRTLSSNGIFTIDNPKESVVEMIEDFRTGKARFHRALNLTYDPIDSFPKDGTKLPEYEFIGDFVTNNAGTGHIVIYRRIVGFSTAQTQQYIDNIMIQINLGTNKITNITHNYVQMFDAIILVSDSLWNSQPYPHAINFNNSGGLWGKTNLKFLKTSRAGYASQFNFKLRVNTHGDNVWLSPVETISANSLPRFIGESKKLGKKIIVTFDDFTDDAHPTGTIDMFDIVDDTHINGLIDDKLPTPRVEKTASDTTATIDPNKLYVFPTMASLSISLNAGDSDIVNEYHFIFTSGTTATNLTLPQTVKKPYGFTVEANTTYEVSIMENCMVVQRWEA